jgi:hypothetical protein
VKVCKSYLVEFVFEIRGEPGEEREALDPTSGLTHTNSGGNLGRSAKRLIPPQVCLVSGEEREALDSTSGRNLVGDSGRSAKRLIPPRVCHVPGEEREALDSTSGEISGRTRGGARSA